MACAGCGLVEWFGSTRPIDPAEGMARLFGRFELIDKLPAVRAPGPDVLMYRPPNRGARTRLAAFPAHVWLRVDDQLWLSHDGRYLMLVPTTPLLMDNVTRGMR